MTFTAADDYLAVDGLENVTIYHRCEESTDSCTAIRVAVQFTEARPSEGVYVAQDCYWQLHPITDLDDDPKVGDVISDADGRNYIVTKVREPIFEDFWGCLTKLPRLYYELSDEVDWEPAVNVLTDDWADRENINPTVTKHFYCRIQPMSTGIQDKFGARGLVDNFTVYTFEEFDVSFGDILVDQNGKRYRVVSWTSKKNLASLMEIQTERLPLGD